MSKLTPYGIAVRKLRLDKGLRLLDVADELKVTPAFLSAIETGRKPIPDGFVVRVGRAMNLNAAELRELRSAVDKTRKEVRVDALPEEQRELVAAFARRLDEVPSDVIARLKKIVLKSTAGEIPFERKRRGMAVPPMKTVEIRNFAEQVRSAFVPDNTVEVPIMDILEFRLGSIFEDFFVDPRSAEEMGEDEGRVVPGSNSIQLREDVYVGAWRGHTRHRFTACHELAHFLMHREVRFARVASDQIFCDSEWQADTFAGTLMMSPRHLGQFKGPEHAADLCKMSPAAAWVMWQKYEKEGRLQSL